MGDFTNRNNEQQQTHTAKNVEIEQIGWDLILQVWFDWSLPPWPPWQGWWPHKLQTFPGPWSSLWQQTSCQCSSCHWPPAPACQDTAPGVCAEPVQSPERHSTQRQYLQHWRGEHKLHSNFTGWDAKFGRTLESMFMPMASPVWDWKRMYKFLPAKLTNSFSRRANLPKANLHWWSVTFYRRDQRKQKYIRSFYFCFQSQCFYWPAGLVKSLFHHAESVRGLQPDFDLCGPASWGQPHHRTPGHTVS